MSTTTYAFMEKEEKYLFIWSYVQLAILLITKFHFLTEYNPMPTEEIVQNFNDLRQDIVLLYELKLALATCDYELETLRHQYEVLNPGKVGNKAGTINQIID